MLIIRATNTNAPHGELPQAFENKIKLISINLSNICPSNTCGGVCMTFSWHYDLARDKYAYSNLHSCHPYSRKKRETKDIGRMKLTVLCLDISDTKSR